MILNLFLKFCRRFFLFGMIYAIISYILTKDHVDIFVKMVIICVCAFLTLIVLDKLLEN